MIPRSLAGLPPRLALAFLGTVLTAHGSPAEGASAPKPQPSAEQRQACKADLQRLCPGILPGGGRVRACFEANLSQLSPLCRQAYDAAAKTG